MDRFSLYVTKARRWCLDAAESYLQELHGANPPGFCYLINLASIDAARSVQETCLPGSPTALRRATPPLLRKAPHRVFAREFPNPPPLAKPPTAAR
ncbi:MAG: hypothetical protein JNJ88_14650 [Planctomycetes bacterium]|nr:hypothetical protein [Planctomycetota bacterium]